MLDINFDIRYPNAIDYGKLYGGRMADVSVPVVDLRDYFDENKREPSSRSWVTPFKLGVCPRQRA